MKNPSFLTQIQDQVWNSGAYMPRDIDLQETTYCNLAVRAVFEAFGYHGFDGMNADQMMVFIHASKDFLIKPIADCQALANEGALVVAGLTSTQLKQTHGHVMTLTPGVEDYSGHWDKKAPVGLSIGRRAICFRSKGINWAFVPEPECFVWVPTL